MDTQTLMFAGLVVNIVATVGGFWRLAMSFERRLTAMETHLEHLLPKRRADRVLE